jgi:acyl carrier protein
MTPSELKSKIITVAQELDLLDEAGALRPLDSIQMIELVVVLEETLGVQIPTSNLRFESFTSLAVLETMLAEVVG